MTPGAAAFFASPIVAKVKAARNDERARRWSALAPNYRAFLAKRGGVPKAGEKAWDELSEIERAAIFEAVGKIEKLNQQARAVFL